MSLATNESIYSAVQQSRGKPESEWYRIAHRVADDYEDAIRRDYIKAIDRIKRDIDMASLRAAVAGGNLSQIQMASGIDRLPAILQGSDSLLEDHMFQAYTATGLAGGEVLADFMDLDFRFNQRDPQSVLFARTQAASMVADIGDQQREALRIIHAIGQDAGLTVDQQARAIREVVGLRKQHVNAPLNLADDIREGRKSRALSRRLSASDKAQIASRMDAGTVDEAFIREMTENYSASLLNRRALDIARTESIRSSNHGLRQSWSQAVDEGVLPQTTRRFPIVTPDERLRLTHAQIPGMNPEGVRLDEPYETPFGPLDGPPWETNCRCGEALLFLRGEEPEAIVDVPEDISRPPADVETPGTERIDTKLRRGEHKALNNALLHDMPDRTSVLDVDLDDRQRAKSEIVDNLKPRVRAHGGYDDAVADLFDSSDLANTVFANVDPTEIGQVAPIVQRFQLGEVGYSGFLDELAEFGLRREVIDQIDDEIAEEFTSSLIQKWAETSADSHPMSQALQKAAQREFGLDDAVTAHWGDSGTYGPKSLNLFEIDDRHGDILQTFVRAQYDDTQAFFADQGIDAVTVFRGMHFDEVPAWVAQGGGVVDDMTLQPLSSFSSTYAKARAFSVGPGSGEVMTAIRVPVEDIMSTARTGFGCLNEGEVVLLGRRYQGFAISLDDIPSDGFITDFWDAVESAGFLGG